MAEDKKEAKKATPVPAKFKKLVNEIEKMSVLELAEFVKVLEDKFGVSAQAPVAVAATPAGDAGDDVAEEKSAYDLELKEIGESKIAVIKLVRDITGQGLKEAKDIVEAAPKVIKEAVPKEEAEKIKGQFDEVGATLELK